MPTYNLRNKKTNEEFTEFCSFSELEELLKKNSDIEQVPSTGIALHSGRGMQKPDNGFRDILKNVKSKHIRSNINTF